MTQLRTFVLSITLASLTALSAPAQAKELLLGATTSQRLTLRVDGLACYFCAYGLERAFKKSGDVAAYDMDMERGLVYLDLAADQPAPTLKDLQKVIYRAGYTPRDEVTADLEGQLVGEPGGWGLELTQVNSTIPLASSEALTAWVAEGNTGAIVHIEGPISSKDSPFLITPSLVTLNEQAAQ